MSKEKFLREIMREHFKIFFLERNALTLDFTSNTGSFIDASIAEKGQFKIIKEITHKGGALRLYKMRWTHKKTTFYLVVPGYEMFPTLEEAYLYLMAH